MDRVFLVCWYDMEAEEDFVEVFRTLDYATRRVVELAETGRYSTIVEKKVNMNGDK